MKLYVYLYTIFLFPQVSAELDSFDGRKDPDRCTALVNHLRQCQDKVGELWMDLYLVGSFQLSFMCSLRMAANVIVVFRLPDLILDAVGTWMNESRKSNGGISMTWHVLLESVKSREQILPNHTCSHPTLPTVIQPHAIRNRACNTTPLSSLSYYPQLMRAVHISPTLSLKQADSKVKLKVVNKWMPDLLPFIYNCFVVGTGKVKLVIICKFVYFPNFLNGQVLLMIIIFGTAQT